MWAWITWIAVALAVWVTIAVLVALVLGRTVRHRDRQVPLDGVDVAFPTPRAAADDPVAGRHPHR